MSLVQMENGQKHQLAEVGICAFILTVSMEGTVYLNTVKTLHFLLTFSLCTCKCDCSSVSFQMRRVNLLQKLLVVKFKVLKSQGICLGRVLAISAGKVFR